MVKVPELRFNEFNDDYKTGKISDFGYFFYGKSAPKSSITKNGKTPCVRYGELYSTYGDCIKDIKSYTNIKPENLILSKGGEVLVPRVGENPLDFANCSYLPLKGVAIGEMISVYNTKENGLYFTYYFNAKMKKKFARVVEGGNVSNLYFKFLEPIKISIPSIQEQNKVVSFLTILDEKIEKQKVKINMLENTKLSLISKLFNQNIRFKDERSNDFPKWEKKKLSDVIKENIKPIKKPNNKYIRLGVRSHAKGVFYEEITNPDYINVDTLYKVEKDNLIVNITFAWEHAVAITSIEDEGKLVSHRFPTYKFKNDQSPLFYKYYISRKRFRYELEKASPGGAGRNRVLNKNDFKNIQINVPSFEEQKKIASFLSTYEKKINLELQKLEEIQTYKNGLLQQMFV